jgi:hemolysin activation/secretion protein
LEKIEVKGVQRLNLDYICSRVALGAGTPLNVARLEDQLRLLRANPLFENIEATLKSGSQPGKSILVVRVTEADPFTGSVGIDNYSPPSIGADRFVLDLAYVNLTGIGDSFVASYRPRLETIEGTYRLEFIYQAPLNPIDGSLQLRALLEPSQVIQEPFNQLDISGDSQWYSVSFRQPIIRKPREELALSLGFTYQQGQTFTFQGPTPFGLGPNEQGISRTSVIVFGQDYTLRDISGAWAFRSQFNFGTSLLDATENPSPIPDGLFFSWLAQAQRAQVIDPDNLLIVNVDFQLTPNPLLPSQQFVIGGGQSVRGYRQNVRAGDNGLRFSIEDQITLVRDGAQEPLFILAPFFDLGYVWNVGDNPNFQPPRRFIAGLGSGFIWRPIKGMEIRLDYAPPLIYLRDQGNNVQDDGFYFSINYKL